MNAKENKHTPTPWELGSNGKAIKGLALTKGAYCIGEVYGTGYKGGWSPDSQANAEFIVRAVNSYEALLEAAKDALCELDPDCNYDGSNYNEEPSDKENDRIQTILGLYKVIAQAEKVLEKGM